MEISYLCDIYFQVSMRIKTFTFNPLSTNCYLVYDNGKAWIIDPSFCNEQEFGRLKQFLLTENIQVEKVLCTHLHFDHIFGASLCENAFHCSIHAHKGDEAWLGEVSRYADYFGIETKGYPIQNIGHLHEDELLTLGNTYAKVLEVPGHSQGGLAFYFPNEKTLFAGDTLFAGSIGRSDLPGGDHAQLIESIRSKLLVLPDDTILYCGHGPSSSIAQEKAENPYL